MPSRNMFFSIVRSKPFGGSMRQSQVDGCNAILDAWASAVPNADLRWVACALGTAYWETDRTMQPIEEIGHGRGRSYGVPAGPWHQVYDGRGDVQLTWEGNYAKADAKLHAMGVLKPEENLVRTPSLAMRQDVAAAIMIFGMIEGWFTGKRLGDFFHGKYADWLNSRTIINGHDHAAEIAEIEEHFYDALLAQATADGNIGIAGPLVSAPVA